MDQNNGWFRLETNHKVQRPAGKNENNDFASISDAYLERTYQMMKRVSSEKKKEEKVEIPDTEVIPAPVDTAVNLDKKMMEQSDFSQEEGDKIYSQTIGDRGPVVIQDGVLHETLETFVNTKIIERAVHVKGYGAFGYFQPYQSMEEYTMLCFLQDPERKTPTATRFSLAVSTKGTPDTSRNVRGFSTKFYTEDGIFDLLCNHIPVFLVRDAIRFPESINALLPSPVNNLIDPNRFWNFVSLAPEATHFII